MDSRRAPEEFLAKSLRIAAEILEAGDNEATRLDGIEQPETGSTQQGFAQRMPPHGGQVRVHRKSAI